MSIKYDAFLSILQHACDKGWVRLDHAKYLARALRWGGDAGVQVSTLAGVRSFRNYEGSSDFKEQVAEAIDSRVREGKTIDVTDWRSTTADLLRKVFVDYFIAPLSARPKPLEPHKSRPVTDHTRTGLNAATIMTYLMHSLRTFDEIAEELKPGYTMYVSDVESAFPLLALTPELWPFMMSRFYSIIHHEGPRKGMLTELLHLFMPVTGDFGTRGMPGFFKMFYVDGVLPMARSLNIITRPAPTWVDDTAYISASESPALREMRRLQTWAEHVLGIFFKWIKDKPSAQVQLMLGFWWDSFERTLTLDETRLQRYMSVLLECSTRRTLSLSERQEMAGRMQWAVRTMPPGAGCLLANAYAMIKGLRLPWQQRRTTAKEREDYRFFHDILSLNLGQGYFSLDGFVEGPTMLSDACKSSDYCGGGWCSSDGYYDWYTYGSRSRRWPIDYLEGDTVVCAVERSMERWAGMWIPYGIDNAAFELSAEKGRSRAERLNLLLKRLFILQIKGNFVLRYFWLSSEQNHLSDHLSRGRVDEFLLTALPSGFFLIGVMVLIAYRDGGRVRAYDSLPPILLAATLGVSSLRRPPHSNMVEYSRRVRATVRIQAVARGILTRAKLRAATALVPELINIDYERFAAAQPDVDIDSTMAVPLGTSSPSPGDTRVRIGLQPSGAIRWFFYLFCCCGEVEAMAVKQTEYSMSAWHLWPDWPLVINHLSALFESSLLGDLACALLIMVTVYIVVRPMAIEPWPPRGFVCRYCKRRPCQCSHDEPSDSEEEVECIDEDEDEHELDESVIAVGNLVQIDEIEFPASPENVPTEEFSPPASAFMAFDLTPPPMDYNPTEATWRRAIDESTPSPSRVRRAQPPPVQRRVTRRAAAGRGHQLFPVQFPFALVACLGVVQAVGHGGISRTELSVSYARSSMYDGLRTDFADRLDQLLDNRLASSSMRTVNAAMTIWREVADIFSWEHVIQTDDLQRGSKVASFIIYMVDHRRELTYDTIMSYVWGWRWWHKMNRQADPVMGVLNYDSLTAALKVLTFVAHEPRRMVPLHLLKAIIEATDVNDFQGVAMVFLLLLLLFTFSRTECPCPKHFTGEESFDPRKHWMQRDVQFRTTSAGAALAIRFKAIKQDPRIERPTARGDGSRRGEAQLGGADWVYVGDVPGIFSIFMWYRRYVAFFPNGRAPTDPLFLSRDMVRPYTYTAFVSDFRSALSHVSADVDYGPHGIRVLGYNLSLEGNGRELTVAQGGWESLAHERYHRFQMGDVLSIPANMVGTENPYSNPPVAREPQRMVMVRGSNSAGGSASTGGPASTTTSVGNPAPPREEPMENPYAASSDEEGAVSPDRVPRSAPARPVAALSATGVNAATVLASPVAVPVGRVVAAQVQVAATARGGSDLRSYRVGGMTDPIAAARRAQPRTPPVTRARQGRGDRGGGGAPSSTC